MSAPRPSLRGRLARFYAAVLVLALGVFAGGMWVAEMLEEANETEAVKAIEPEEHPYRNLLLMLAGALVPSVAVAIAGASLIARRALAPLDDAVATAARIGTENLGERVPVRVDAVAETARLVEALNAMLARLDRSVAGMRRFTADASHELRTPLATLSSEIELALVRPRAPEEYRAALESAREQLGLLARLVEGLLVLARSDAGSLPLAPVETDLAQLGRDAASPYEAVLEGSGKRLRVTAPATASATVDPLWTARAVANLVDNAARHAATEVAVTVDADEDAVRIAVSDDGPGVAAADRERIFERFYRGESSRASGGGAGLGLPLAREIARAHGGDLVLDGAARFVLSFPRRR